MRKSDLDRLQNLGNKAVNYEVARTKINNFSLFLFRQGSPLLFVLSRLSGDDGFRVCEHHRGFMPPPERRSVNKRVAHIGTVIQMLFVGGGGGLRLFARAAGLVLSLGSRTFISLIR